MLISVVDIYSCNFFCTSFFLILRQINVKHSFTNVTRKVRVNNTHEHTCEYANLDLSEMDIIVQVTGNSLKSL